MNTTTALNPSHEAPGYALALHILAESLRQLAAFVPALLAYLYKAQYVPPRTHYNVARPNDGRIPVCGQVSGRKTGWAQTFYTHSLTAVNCKRCLKTRHYRSLSQLAALGAVGAQAFAELGGVQ